MTCVMRVSFYGAWMRCYHYEEEKQNAFKGAAQDVYELAADHDGPACGDGHLGLYRGQEGWFYHDRVYPGLSGDRGRPVFL